MDEQKTEACLFSLWNGAITRQAAQQEMRRLLSRRTPHRLFGDFRRRLLKGGDSRLPHDVFVTTCALFCRGGDSAKTIASALEETHMERMLFTGLRVFLHNKSKGRKISIKWSDYSLSNEYEWISCFAGRSHDYKYCELLSVVRLLYEWDMDALWVLAKEDPNDLLLVSWFGTFRRVPPFEKALELLTPAESRRRQALAFWWLTFRLQDCGEAEERADVMLEQLVRVPEEVLVPCLFEFLVSAQVCPAAFCAYLVKASRDALLCAQMRRVELLTNWKKAAAVATLICEVASVRRQEHCWNILVKTVEKKLKVGELTIVGKTSDMFLFRLPTQHLTRFQTNIRVWNQSLHTECIDSMLRPQLFNQDVALQATAEKILTYSVGR